MRSRTLPLDDRFVADACRSNAAPLGRLEREPGVDHEPKTTPKEVFDGVIGLVQTVLPPADYTAVAARLGLDAA
jgi:hypothetical protein